MVRQDYRDQTGLLRGWAEQVGGPIHGRDRTGYLAGSFDLRSDETRDRTLRLVGGRDVFVAWSRPANLDWQGALDEGCAIWDDSAAAKIPDLDLHDVAAARLAGGREIEQDAIMRLVGRDDLWIAVPSLCVGKAITFAMLAVKWVNDIPQKMPFPRDA